MRTCLASTIVVFVLTRAHSVTACPACSETIARTSQAGFGAAINLTTIGMIALPIVLVVIAAIVIRRMAALPEVTGRSPEAESHSSSTQWSTPS